jgi:hypothetical protein
MQPSHEPHCPVPRAEQRGEKAVCLCRQVNLVDEPLRQELIGLVDRSLEKFIASMEWYEASEEVRELITGNLRGFAILLQTELKSTYPTQS